MPSVDYPFGAKSQYGPTVNSTPRHPEPHEAKRDVLRPRPAPSSPPLVLTLDRLGCSKPTRRMSPGQRASSQRPRRSTRGRHQPACPSTGAQPRRYQGARARRPCAPRPRPSADPMQKRKGVRAARVVRGTRSATRRNPTVVVHRRDARSSRHHPTRSPTGASSEVQGGEGPGAPAHPDLARRPIQKRKGLRAARAVQRTGSRSATRY